MEKEVEKKTNTKKKKVKEVKKKVNKPKVNKESKLQLENKELNEKILRLSAEMQNMRRRFDEEMARACKYDGEELVIKLLTIVDNFERAINLDDSNLTDELSKFLEGFKMIYGNLKNILENMEIKEIDCLKQKFDPNTMEAVLTAHEENIEPGIVLDVLQKGYTYKDKVIRHSMVRVSE